MGFLSPHKSPVFEPDGAHSRLFKDVLTYSRLAGIRKEWIWEPLDGRVSANERKWVSHFKGHSDRGSYGILWLGTPPAERVPAIVGALTRNFIDARLRTVAEVVDDTDAQRCTALFLTDFCLTGDTPMPSVRQALSSMLLRRATDGKQTGLYAVSPSAIQQAYGDAVAELLKGSYLKVSQ